MISGEIEVRDAEKYVEARGVKVCGLISISGICKSRNGVL